jgi:RNA polymerase sigma-70 factor (ECF subfamily)
MHMNENPLIAHLFRQEYRKITAVLCRHFGAGFMDAAEDIAADTFLTAAELWGMKGLPEKPVAWLYATAKNKARDLLKRRQIFQEKVALHAAATEDETTETDIDFSEQAISDSQLQMMFAICHPAISEEAQIGLSLRILCGFGIDEIAAALLIKCETVKKRLVRAKEKLRAEGIKMETPPAHEIEGRLDTVLRTLYLLFTEGYASSGADAVLRKDLCLEAVRLVLLLSENTITAAPRVHALLALMCFHASRFDARTDAQGDIILYDEQDERLWDAGLIAKGEYFLNLAARGPALSKYHLEAGIAYWHTVKADSDEKWESILQLYNRLLVLEYSPLAALNRTYALAKARGRTAALAEARKLALEDNPQYHALLGTLCAGDDNAAAALHFRQAHALSESPFEKAVLAKKIACCEEALERNRKLHA